MTTVKTKDGEVEILDGRMITMHNEKEGFQDSYAQKPMATLLQTGELRNKAISLNDVYYDWHLGYDEKGGLIIFPVRKF